MESKKPAELLAQDSFFVGHLKRLSKVYLQAVADTYGSYAFAYLHAGKSPEHVLAVLHNDALPSYEEWGLKVDAILTDNRRESCRKDSHPYELYLPLGDIDHRKTRLRRPQTKGFVKHFDRTALDEFFRKPFREKLSASVDALQDDMDRWLKFYNEEPPHQGYRNTGKHHIDTINRFINLSANKASRTPYHCHLGGVILQKGWLKALTKKPYKH